MPVFLNNGIDSDQNLASGEDQTDTDSAESGQQTSCERWEEEAAGRVQNYNREQLIEYQESIDYLQEIVQQRAQFTRDGV